MRVDGVWKGVLVAVLALVVQVGQAAVIAEADPVVQVQRVSDQLIARLEQDRARLEKDPASVQRLAGELVFPYVDIQKMSRFVMGQYWRSATPEQQASFSALFQDILLSSYANSFLKLQIDRVVFGAVRAGSGSKDVEVPASVHERGGNVVPVVFRLYPSGNSWKVFDVEIEGVSLMLNYRTLYGQEIAQKGVAGVIAGMKDKVNGRP